MPDSEKAPVALLLAAKEGSGRPSARRGPWCATGDSGPDRGPRWFEIRTGSEARPGRVRPAQCAPPATGSEAKAGLWDRISRGGNPVCAGRCFEILTEPSAVISEQYQNTSVTLKSGDEIVGRIVEDTPRSSAGRGSHPGNQVEVRPADVTSRTPRRFPRCPRDCSTPSAGTKSLTSSVPAGRRKTLSGSTRFAVNRKPAGPAEPDPVSGRIWRSLPGGNPD